MHHLLVAVVIALAVVTAPVPAHGQSPPSDQTATAEQIFVNTCGFCHQAGGRVAGRGPKLAGTERPDEYLINRIRLGKEGAMPAYGRAFTESQLRALVTYIRSLKDDGR
jgi:mono/diheme cytochrome c family protein